MTVQAAENGRDPVAYVPTRSSGMGGPVCRFALGPADRPLVSVGATIGVGDPLLERVHDVSHAQVSEVTGPEATGPEAIGPQGTGSGATALQAARPPLEPGQEVDGAVLLSLNRGRRRFRQGDRATVLYRGTDGRAHLAVGRAPETVTSVIAGTVIAVDGSGIDVRADGDGIPAAVAWGQPVRGPLLIAVASPDGELRASAVDVAAAGSIIVAGARIDIEALTRARALGVRGVICGGLIGKELRQLEAAEARQRASIHPVAPFGLLLLDGYGRRPIPGPWWDALTSAAGRDVTINPDPPLVVLDSGVVRPATQGTVRVVAGDDLGREGRLLDIRGMVRVTGGTYLPSGLVALHGRTPSDPPERRVLPLTDLERLD